MVCYFSKNLFIKSRFWHFKFVEHKIKVLQRVLTNTISDE